MIPPKPNQAARCSVETLPHHEVRFAIDGRELTRWIFSLDTPRPYFYPICGPSGISLSRIGHPGAPNHDHHRSLWFAHHDLLGNSFWTEESPARIRQNQWYVAEETDQHGRLAVELHWLDGHNPTPLIKQDLIMTVRPQPTLGHKAWSLELQSDFRATGDGVEFRQSNFGILGLRVARSLSVIFGQGAIQGENGGSGEAALFGQPNRWISYSGPVAPTAYAPGIGLPGREALTLVDHVKNPGHGNDGWASWHVRDDGWIGPSLSRHSAIPIPSGHGPSDKGTTAAPLTVRYLLLVHPEPAPQEALQAIADTFDASETLSIQSSRRPHHQWEITVA